MGRDSGIALLVLGIIALFSLKPRELTAADFYPTFNGIPPVNGNGLPPITYKQYVTYVTKPETELEEGEAFEESVTTSGRVGRWLTVNGMIPTPSGGLIPLPTIHVGRTPVDVMLQPIEEASAYSDEPQDRLDPSTGKMIIDVSARLKPI